MNKILRKIENYLQTDTGQRLLQYGYSFGAAIVIFGAMIKVLHLWGVWGNIIFGFGMGVEVIVFILYGLDRPASAQTQQVVQQPIYTQQPAPQASHVAQPTPAPQPQQPSYTPVQCDAQLGDLSAVSHNVAQFAEATETLTQIANTLQNSYQYLSNNSLDVGAETEKLTRQIQELNQIYARMIQAMTSQQNPQ